MPNQSPDTSSNKTTPSKNRARPPRPNPRFLADLQQLGYQRIIGLDEVGRGAGAGPLVVAAVEIYAEIDGIHDSKLLSKSRRTVLAQIIAQQATQIRFGVAQSTEIDLLGLTKATELAYARCLSQCEFDLILTDHVKISSVKYLSSIKGDRFFYPVSAASIIAKVYRDQLMQIYGQFYPTFNWSKNVGYLTSEHISAIELQGISPLHRQSFLP